MKPNWPAPVNASALAITRAKTHWAIALLLLFAFTISTSIAFGKPLHARSAGPRRDARSGIQGQTLVPMFVIDYNSRDLPEPRFEIVPVAVTLRIYSQSGRVIGSVRSQPDGFFQINL